MWRSGNRPVQANIATLKVHLGRYLKLVRKGIEVIVLDRQTPVARIVPTLAEGQLIVREAKVPLQDVLNLLKENDRKLKRSRLKRSSLDYLAIERQTR